MQAVPVMLVIETEIPVPDGEDPEAIIGAHREAWRMWPKEVGDHLAAHGVSWLNVQRYPKGT